jgi:hypothetical protein
MRMSRFALAAALAAMAGSGLSSMAFAREGNGSSGVSTVRRGGEGVRRPTIRPPRRPHFDTEAPSNLLSNWGTAVAPGVYHGVVHPRTGTSSSPH